MLIEKFVPRREMQLPWLLRWFNFTWALIGNDDDGLFGDDRWRAGREKTLWLAIVWWFRNPFHNSFSTSSGSLIARALSTRRVSGARLAGRSTRSTAPSHGFAGCGCRSSHTEARG